MFKKIGILTVLLVGGIIFFGSSYGSVVWDKVCAKFEKHITPEMKLEMIRKDVANLNTDLKKHINSVAEEEVEVRKLRREIADADKAHQQQLQEILTLKQDLNDHPDYTAFDYDGQKISADRVRRRLESDWESYKRVEETLKSKRQLLEAKEASLAASKERLDAMRDKKEQLEVKLAQLEAEYKKVRRDQTKSNYNFDDSKVGEIEKSIAEFRDYVEAEKLKVEYEGKYANDNWKVRKETKPTDTIKEIDAYVTKNGKVETKSDTKVDDKVAADKK